MSRVVSTTCAQGTMIRVWEGLSISLLKYICINPKKAFQIGIGNPGVVLVVFVVTYLITLVKSLSMKGHSITFYESHMINSFFSFVSIPSVRVNIAYLAYFMSIIVMYASCRYINSSCNYRSLLLSMMSLSGVGIYGRSFMSIIGLIFPKTNLLGFQYLFLAWVVAISICAIKESQGVSLPKAAFCFFVGVLPFFIFGGFSMLAPYLAFL